MSITAAKKHSPSPPPSHQDRGTGVTALGGPWSFRDAFGTFIPALHANLNKPTQQGGPLICCYSFMEMKLLAPLRKESV